MNLSMKYYREDSFNRDGDPYYFCSLCEEEGGVMTTSSEIKITSSASIKILISLSILALKVLAVKNYRKSL